MDFRRFFTILGEYRHRWRIIPWGLCIFFFATTPAQEVTILPFDWSGQNGLITVDGSLFWNRDWNAGVLFLDGSFTSYPLRYGLQFQQRFAPQVPAVFPVSDTLPDSAFVTTIVDYRRGDYLYNQLEIRSTLAQQKTVLNLYGFKRSYGGPWGQYYQQSRGPVGPIQQSYRVDYRSQKSSRQWESAVAYLVTNSGLPDTSFVKRGHHRDHITTGTLIYRYRVSTWAWLSRGTLFNQVTHVGSTTGSFSGTRYFTRGRLHNRWSSLSEAGPRWSLGVVANFQDYSLASQGLKQRSWAILYGGRKTSWGELQLGFGRGPQESRPYFYFQSQTLLTGLQLDLQLSVEPRPRLISYWQSANEHFFENWSRGILFLSRQGLRTELWGKVMVTRVDNYLSLKEDMAADTPVTIQAFTYESGWNFRLFRAWFFRGSYQFTTPQDPLSDGVGKRLILGINGQETLFNGKMDTRLRLWVERWFDRDTTLGFHPFQGTPFQVQDTRNSLSGNWIVYFQVSAKVSTLKFTYRVNNVLYAIKPVAQDILPGLEESDLWIRNNYLLNGVQYPMGRMVSFQIEWEFKD